MASTTLIASAHCRFIFLTWSSVRSPGWRSISARGQLLVSLVLLLFATAPVCADPLLALPIAKVETGTHTGFIKKLSMDYRYQRVLSVSDDKTARIWDLATGRLLRTLRAPIGDRHEGQLYAAAISPDGRIAAVAGYTGWQWDETASVYLFEMDSGNLVRRVDKLSTSIENLAYSKDGRYLAVCLADGHGLWVFETRGYTPIGWDDNYEEKILGIDFSPEGDLVTTSVDGVVRLYDRTFKTVDRTLKPKATTLLAKGSEPFHAYFSPDGNEIAIGLHGAPGAIILSAGDLSRQRWLDGRAFGQRRLLAVAWSRDGKYLYAGGEATGGGNTRILRWNRDRQGEPEIISIGPYRLSDLHGLDDGFVYSTGAPAIGRFDASGRKLWMQPKEAAPVIADYRDAGDSFRVSDDGLSILFPYVRDGQNLAYFLAKKQELGGPAQLEKPLLPPLRYSSSLTLTDCQGSNTPTLNGKPLKDLDSHEECQSYVFSRDGRAVLLGTLWALRLYSTDGNRQWKTPLSAFALAVNVSRDNRWAVAALSDGTIRWYRMSNGEEVLALFPHGNGKDWILWVPAGYYVSSSFGDRYIGWHLNRGKESSADFYLAVQLERKFYSPPHLVGYVNAMPDQDSSMMAFSDQLGIAELDKLAPPRIQKLSISEAAPQSGKAILQFTAHRSHAQMQEFVVFVNDVPITPTEERQLAGTDKDYLERKVMFDVAQEHNEIRVEITNESNSVGVGEAYFHAGSVAKAPRGNLYLLAIGVNDFPNAPDRRLKFAAQDASGIASLFRQVGGRRYERVFLRVLSDTTDEPADKASILAALKFLKKSRASDTVVVFLSSHGVGDSLGNYYFMPRDALASDIDAVVNGQIETEHSLIQWNHFIEEVTSIAGKRLLIVDTCKAGSIVGPLNEQRLKKRSGSSRFALFASAKGGEESWEYPLGNGKGHGVFTLALLEGLQGKADANRDGGVTVEELYDYARPRVKELNEKLKGWGNPEIREQNPQLDAPESLRAMVLTRTGI